MPDGAGGRSEPARHRAGLPAGGAARRLPRRHLVVTAGRAARDETDGSRRVLPWLAKHRGTDTRFSRTSSRPSASASPASTRWSPDSSAGGGARRSARTFPQISMRVTVEGEPGDAERKLEELSARVRERFASYHLRRGRRLDGEVVAQLLIQHGFTLAVAESCTGGLIGHRLTNVPGLEILPRRLRHLLQRA